MKPNVELGWLEAIIKVLEEAKAPLHYSDIANIIIEKGYRNNVGSTPPNTVNSYINTEIGNGRKSRIAKVARGIYILKDFLDDFQNDIPIEVENDNIIECYGRYWDRNLVDWTAQNIKLLGNQDIGEEVIDFSNEIGVYFLHCGKDIVYVGQTTGQTIGKRVAQHTTDRLRGRWTSFSWFGFYPVKNGKVSTAKSHVEKITLDKLADTIEALFIESIDPCLNRQSGKNFRDKEYFQVQDTDFPVGKF